MAQTSKASKRTKITPDDPTSGEFIGAACGQDVVCRQGLACLSLYGDESGAYPAGMCTTICPKHTCPDDPAHGTSRCVQWPHEAQAICLIDCSATRRCERADYRCERVERSGERGTRHVCVPQEKAAVAAFQKYTVNGTPSPPKGTVKLDDMVAKWQGSPITFATADHLHSLSADHAADEDEASVRENESTDNDVRDSDAGGDTAESAAEPAAQLASDAAEEQPSAHQEVESQPATPASDSLNVVSIVIIIAVGAITLLTLLRMAFSRRFGGLVRSVRDAAGEETALGRVRHIERKKRSNVESAGQGPEVRVERRRSPVRPLRSIPGGHDDAHDDIPVLSRDDAIAREKIAPPTPEELAAEAEKDARLAQSEADAAHSVNDAPEATDTTEQTAGNEEAEPEEPAGPPAFTPEDLRTFSTLRRASIKKGVEQETAASETPDASYTAEETAAPPTALVDDSSRAQLWSRARAARTFRANRVSPAHSEQTSIKDMDEFVAPLPIDIVLQLLDELLSYAENVRQRKGYDAIVYIETDPQKTIFRRGPEGEIRVQHAADALAKPVLAVDAMRRKGFPTTVKVPDAHLLSLVHLGRYLLGSASADDVVVDIDALSTASSRFSDEEIQLMRFLLSPEEHAHLQHMATSRGRSGGFSGKEAAAPHEASTNVDWLPCPDCASEVKVGDLACGQCGVALHPRPIFCSACGTLNIPFADGRAQICANISCDQELLAGPMGADVESRRLAVVASLLSSFDEFRKLPAPGDAECYVAETEGRTVEIWQIAADRGTVILEDDRPHYGLSDLFTLPRRFVDKSGVRFIIYDPPTPKNHLLSSLGPSKLAEALLLLWDEVHKAKLRGPALRFEDLTVSDSGDVQLLHGHVLRESTAATPRIHDTRFMAPELARQAIATERTDLYTLAAIWVYAVSGTLPSSEDFSASDAFFEGDAFIGASDLVIELMAQCLREEAADRPASVHYMLTQLRERRRLSDLI